MCVRSSPWGLKVITIGGHFNEICIRMRRDWCNGVFVMRFERANIFLKTFELYLSFCNKDRVILKYILHVLKTYLK